MKNILIFGYCGYGNLGDETNLWQLIKLLREIDERNKITVISAAPNRTAKTYHVASVGKFNPFGIIRALIKADHLLGNSGSLFQDVTSKRSLFYYAALVILAKLFGTKVFLYGQGIGPLRSGIGRLIAGRVLSMVDLITVRDRFSIITLTELNVRKPEVHLTAEPLLALNNLETSLVTGSWERPQKYHRLKLGLVIQELKFIKKTFWNHLLECLSWEPNAEIYLIPIQPVKDSDFLQELSADFKLLVLPINDGWERLQQVVLGLDLLVSTRLHGLVAGVLQGVPCYGLAADPKVEGFCLQLGIPFTLLTFETEWLGICDQIISFLEKPFQECTAYQCKLPFWKGRALENQIILKQYLRDDD